MSKIHTLVPRSRWTRFFLILLRLAIGWHLFIEGVSKLESMRIGPSDTNKVFSSRGYLQQSAGPLSPLFKWMAGDPDAEASARLDFKTGEVPSLLKLEWEAYLDRFSKHYVLTAEQKKLAEDVFLRKLTDLKSWFQSGTKAVTKSYSFTTINPLEKNQERIVEYRSKLIELEESTNQVLPKLEKDVLKAKLNGLKADVARLRSELLKDLDEQAQGLRTELEKVLTPEQKDKDAEQYSPILQPYLGKSGYTEHHRAAMDLLLRVGMENRADLLELAEKDPARFLTTIRQDAKFKEVFQKIAKEKVAPQFKSESRLLTIADYSVAWGLTIAGAGLLLGLFTRTSCLMGAGLLLLFFLALPPLPGLPDNPMAEGKYLFVNKNLIELIALLALSTTPSGRWLGLDALLAYLWPFKYLASRPAPLVDVE